MDFSFKVDGLKDLEKAMNKLEDRGIGVKILRSAGRKAMKPVLEDAKANVAVRTGSLRDSLMATSKTSRRYKSVSIFIGPQRKSRTRKGVKTTYNKQLNQRKTLALEYGTKKQAPKPFLRPALDKNAAQVLSLFKDHVAAAIDKAVRGI